LGALSVLLPFLRERGERPAIYVGTSIGAVQAAYLAARAGDRPDRVLEEGRASWRNMELGRILSSPLAPRQLVLPLRYLASAAGLPVGPPPSLLALKRMREIVERLSQVHRIPESRRRGDVIAVAAVTTSSRTGRSVVFHDGGGHPESDDRRGIDYVATRLTADHIQASLAIPFAFPAVCVGEPKHARGWYVDGGARLNAPIKPALALGAKRLVIVGLNSTRPGRGSDAPRRPDAIDGLGHLTQAILADPLNDDVQTLARLNQVAGVSRRNGGYEAIEYIFVTPERRDRIGELAAEVFRESYTGLRGLRSPRLRLLGRLVDAGASPEHGELLSYLFFAPEFVDELVELGKRDADTWLKTAHDAGHWQLRPLP
jgi:NTE family protein